MEAAAGDRHTPWLRRLKYFLGLLRNKLTSDLENADSQLALHHSLSELIRSTCGPAPSRLRILEIGCGQRASQTILLTADGFEATGIDLEISTFRMTVKSLFQIITANGWERALKSIFRHGLFDGPFFRRLSSLYGQPLPLDRVDVRVMDATRLEFPDDYFDFIFSTLVFEHIDDVPAAVREVNRTLKPQGRAWINVHLFPSLSGGHQAEWTNPRSSSPSRIPPWDHLLEQKFPAGTYLNKLRWADYQKIFREHLVVLEEQPVLEPANMLKTLTLELEQILLAQGYTREDLLTREVAFLCRKKGRG